MHTILFWLGIFEDQRDSTEDALDISVSLLIFPKTELTIWMNFQENIFRHDSVATRI